MMPRTYGATSVARSKLVPGLDPARVDASRAASLVRIGPVGLRGAGRGDLAAGRHSGTSVTELVYRHQLRPVIQTGATVMDRLFSLRDQRA